MIATLIDRYSIGVHPKFSYYCYITTDTVARLKGDVAVRLFFIHCVLHHEIIMSHLNSKLQVNNKNY